MVNACSSRRLAASVCGILLLFSLGDQSLASASVGSEGRQSSLAGIDLLGFFGFLDWRRFADATNCSFSVGGASGNVPEEVRALLSPRQSLVIFPVWNSKAGQGNPVPSSNPTIKMTTSLCVTDLLNILLVDVPVIPAVDDVADAAAAVPKKGAAIVLPPAGKFSCAARVPTFGQPRRGEVYLRPMAYLCAFAHDESN